jgi:hypothetical protein
MGVVVVRQHRGAHVPLEGLQRQVAPLVARRGSAARIVEMLNSCTTRESPCLKSSTSSSTSSVDPGAKGAG